MSPALLASDASTEAVSSVATVRFSLSDLMNKDMDLLTLSPKERLTKLV